MKHLTLASLILSLGCAAPLSAGVPEAVQDHALPAVQSFAVQARALAVNAAADCTAAAVIPSYHNVFDAWLGLAHLGFGPLETDGRALTIAFWPDKRGMVASTVARLVADQDAAVSDAGEFAQVSIAGRGLFALERLLFDPDYAGYGRDDYSCRLVAAIAGDLDRMAGAIAADWSDEAAALLSAGEEGNSRYLSEAEAAQRLYTALLAGLEFVADQRLGRPLGTFDRPRPERAEARRSDRSLRNVTLSIAALSDLAQALSTAPTPVTDQAFADALDEARALDDPIFDGVSDPSGRLRVEILQQRVQAIRTAVSAEIGAQLGVGTGFNSADGD
ncbi:imelysin family protein [Pseudooceanicola nitratireducens]|uniref:imelysin family protein n=1 Tax=Pseudooceanicola nitratireducens TaxID=517719 RepID=UPI001C949DD4|nr:imelysin family protein [Pseudooceanicola nitratireducens]MBY6158063.1 imelysin family protein [Pseudooceanicola nitratireducens]